MACMLWMIILFCSGYPKLFESSVITGPVARTVSMTRLGFLILLAEGTIGKYLNLTKEGLDEHEQKLITRKVSKLNRTRKGVPGVMADNSQRVGVGAVNSSMSIVPNSAQNATIAATHVILDKNKKASDNGTVSSSWWQQIGNLSALLTSSVKTTRPAASSPLQMQLSEVPKSGHPPSQHKAPISAPSYSPAHQIESRCTEHVRDSAHRIPVFWVNMDQSTARREYFSAQMQAMGLKNKRITATTPDSILTKEVQVDVEPKVPHTPKEISCVISHLIAIREAIYDKTLGPKNPFALITEDDVSFEMNVNFRALIASAPKPFVGLQLMSSAENEVKRLWQDYKKNPVPTNLWEQRKLESFFWSAQAYLINKTALKPLIDDIFSFKDGSAGTGLASASQSSSYDNMRVRIINPPKAFPCKKGSKCYFPMRLVSDTYIYALCYPTFVTKIPIFNGHRVGGNTTIHMRKQNDDSHAKAFLEIAKLLDEVRKSSIVPSHITPKKCDL